MLLMLLIAITKKKGRLLEVVISKELLWSIPQIPVSVLLVTTIYSFWFHIDKKWTINAYTLQRHFWFWLDTYFMWKLKWKEGVGISTGNRVS
jgi:hypothetical protein